MSKNRLPDPSKLFSKEAEAAVLGSMLIDPPCIPKVLPRLPRSEAFFMTEHRVLYDALVKLYIADKPIDAISLRTELKEQGKLDEVGGVDYIRRLLDSVPSSANVLYYSDVIREKQKERQVRAVVTEIAEIPEQPGSVDEMIQRIQDIALELEPTKSGPDFIEVRKIASQVAEGMKESRADAIETGFRDLDRLIHGFCPGEFVILAGRPSMGKSALALCMAINMAKARTAVFFSSLEMTERSLVERALCSLAAVDMELIQSRQATEEDWMEIDGQALALSQHDIVISKIAYTPEQLAGLIHRLKQTHNVGICFVDYLQLMGTGKKAESRQQEITTISRKLKSIALREDIPIVALSQLNRAVDSREDHRPRMSDLRESGSLEQDADLVLFVYREDYYQQEKPGFDPDGIAEILVRKNRRGPVGMVKMVFVHDYVKFSDLLRGAQYYE